MFTDGLDENAINWVKQGSEAEEPKVRSPLAEKLDPIPKSPIRYNTNGFMSPHVLPPLKFNSGLLKPHTLFDLDASIGRRYDSDYDENDEDQESVASVSDDMNLDSSEEEYGGLRHKGNALNRGGLNLENLRIGGGGVHENVRRYTTDGGFGERKCTADKLTTPGSASGALLRDRVLSRNVGQSRFADGNTPVRREPVGTPSAPPIMNLGNEDENMEVENEQDKALGDLTEDEVSGNGPSVSAFSPGYEGGGDWKANESFDDAELGERINKAVPEEKEVHVPLWQSNPLDPSPYNTSGQYAWQTLIAYDACIRLCLHAWARGCTEAPEFLRDECLVLRSAFGLQKFLLHPRSLKPIEGRSTKSVESCPMKTKKIVGKIRVEVRKLRIIPRRKLKNTSSQRSTLYIQAGTEYIKHVSSLMKTGINSLKLASLGMLSEETFSCFFQLKSASEDSQAESNTSICLNPGSGDYHVFFPESQGDALLVEVQDRKKSVQGRATIPISSLTDNTTEKVRWWPIYQDDLECVGKIQLSVGITVSSDENHQIKGGLVAETLAYDIVLDAALRVRHFHSRNLRLCGPWKWLLSEFSNYYEVSDSYTKLRYLSQVMTVATPTKDCLDLVNELLISIIKAKSEKILTRQEVSFWTKYKEKAILLDCETQIESVLASVFENYKFLNESSATGLADLSGTYQESAAPALASAVQVFTLLHDILAEDAQTMLRKYLHTAAWKRCRKHMLETDEFLSSNTESLLMDHVTLTTAYLKMRNLCINLSNELQSDIKIHNQHILPSSIDLSNIAAAVYSTELSSRLKAFLSAWPPSSPLPHVNELLKATADFERNLESWNISPVQGGLSSRNLFHSYILVWVQDMQLNLLELCKAEKVPWSGVLTNQFTSPFAEEMYETLRSTLTEYEVVINHWPHYTLILENATADVERAIIKALEKQYYDILTPLKDSIQKRLNMQVQKLRRQSTTLYSCPSQLGTFLNTIKRILDVLHYKVEDILKGWASYLPVTGEKKSLYGEQMNGITVLLRTKYKNYLQAIVGQLVNNLQANRGTRLKRILEETKEEDGEVEVRERMQMLSSQLTDSISNLHEVFSSQIFVATCRGLWDRTGQIVLKFLEGRKENRVWYNGSYYALGILDDTFASQMQRLQGNALQEKDLEPPRSVIEARSILSRDAANATDPSTYFFA